VRQHRRAARSRSEVKWSSVGGKVMNARAGKSEQAVAIQFRRVP
jgi:hypothetical protein